MRSITVTQLHELAKAAGVKKRLLQELRFLPENVADWSELEYLPVYDRSQAKGLLIIEIDSGLYLTPFELSRGIGDQSTGRLKPIICDLCFTWQGGGNAGRITATRKSDQHVISYLCCADLRCSDHVRTKTTAAQRSRTQLREDLNNEQRAERLKQKLQGFVDNLGLQPIDT
jgi:hypothetical protein